MGIIPRFILRAANLLDGGVAPVSPQGSPQGLACSGMFSCQGRGDVYDDVVEAKGAELLPLKTVCTRDVCTTSSARYLVSLRKKGNETFNPFTPKSA